MKTNATQIGLMAQFEMIADASRGSNDEAGQTQSAMLVGAALALQRLRVICGGSYVSVDDVAKVEGEIAGAFCPSQADEQPAPAATPVAVSSIAHLEEEFKV